MIKFCIEPFDVLFFGGGKPFNIGSVVQSIEFPFPHTFAGAISSIFQDLPGINENKILKNVYGPFLIKGETLYFPFPASIVKSKNNNTFHCLSILDENEQILVKSNYTNKINESKINESCLFYKGPDEVENFNGFLSLKGLEKWLENEDIDSSYVAHYSEIFEKEGRIGIKIDNQTNTVKDDDALYRIVFSRLKNGWKFVFFVEFDFDNKNNSNIKRRFEDENELVEYLRKVGVIKLGGEMRTASFNVELENFKDYFEQKIELKKDNIYRILFLTYFTLDENSSFDYLSCENNNNFDIIAVASRGLCNLAINSKALQLTNFTKRTKRALKPGSVFYVKPKQDCIIDVVTFFNKPKNFIGSNLGIIAKEGGN